MASRRLPRLPHGVTLYRRAADIAEEIHLRGMSVDDALGRVDKFLDDAYMAGLVQVRLVHGVGSGRLKRAIADFLERHPHVQGAARAADEEGGIGVTLVTLRP